MRANEIREMDVDKATEQLEEAREAYFKLRFQFATGQLPDTSKLRAARRDVARVATVLRELKAARLSDSTRLPPTSQEASE